METRIKGPPPPLDEEEYHRRSGSVHSPPTQIPVPEGRLAALMTALVAWASANASEQLLIAADYEIHNNFGISAAAVQEMAATQARHAQFLASSLANANIEQRAMPATVRQWTDDGGGP